MAIYPASVVLHERAAPPSLAQYRAFTVKPDSSLPLTTPSPPKPRSSRASAGPIN